MRVLVTGANGLIGKHVCGGLASREHEVLMAVRQSSGAANEMPWSAERGFSADEINKIGTLDAIIHLAGDNVAGGSWTAEKKKSIRESRIFGTRAVVDLISRLDQKPKMLVSASATGYYGVRGDEVLTEEALAGEGFLSEVCIEWENEAKRAEEFGARVVLLRISAVLTLEGGALAKMLTPFKMGVGGIVGSGKQWMSWISLRDVVSLLMFCLENGDINGVMNACSPHPVTNEQFTKALGAAIHRPTIFPVPEFVIKLLYGEMGEALILGSTRVVPKLALEKGFVFEDSDVEDCLAYLFS